MIEIQLNRGYTALINDEDAHLAARNWRVFIPKSGRGKLVYATCQGKLLHREVMQAVKGGPRVDHVDGNGLDCRRHNLRYATGRQNAANARLSSRNTSGFKGVSFKKDRGLWCAQINYAVGFFKTAEEAARAYDKEMQRIYGAYARLNFPDPPELEV